MLFAIVFLVLGPPPGPFDGLPDAVHAPPAPKAVPHRAGDDVPGLRATNDALRPDYDAAVGKAIAQLGEIRQLLTEVAALNEQVRLLRIENAALKAGNASLATELHRIRAPLYVEPLLRVLCECAGPRGVCVCAPAECSCTACRTRDNLPLRPAMP